MLPEERELSSLLLEITARADTTIVMDVSNPRPKDARAVHARAGDTVSHASRPRIRQVALRSPRRSAAWSSKTNDSCPSEATTSSAPTSLASTSSWRWVSVILVPVSAETSEAVTRPPNLVMAPSRGLDGSSAGAHDKGGELRLLRRSGWLGARPGERRRE